ncbi:phosphotransferase [Streptomyces bobili]|uniref:phosphotransferase n=1 Tax=Streptomyces bobili TaxID=67280 RepID=UPI00341A459A
MAETTEPTPAAKSVIESIPMFSETGPILIESLEGVQSLNNNLWVVRCESGERFVVRQADPVSATRLGVNYPDEAAVARAAATIGIAPEVLYCDPSIGLIVTPWVEPLPPQQRGGLGSPGTMKRLVEVLHRMHGLTDVPGRPGAIYDRIRHLVGQSRDMGLSLPPGVGDALLRLDDFEAHRAAQAGAPPGLNHNDLWENNILDSGDQLFLVDWEFAGLGDGLYDLATISMAGAFDADLDRRLLGEYGSDARQDLVELQSMKWVVRFFEATWSLVMHGLNGHTTGSGFDYSGHARVMFSAMEEEPPAVRL